MSIKREDIDNREISPRAA